MIQVNFKRQLLLNNVIYNIFYKLINYIVIINFMELFHLLLFVFMHSTRKNVILT